MNRIAQIVSQPRARAWSPQLAIGGLIAAGVAVLAVAPDPSGAVVALAALVPAAVYAGAVLGPRAARIHAAALLLAPVVVLAVAGASAISAFWLPVAVTLAATVELLGRYTRGLRREAVTDQLTGLYNRNGFLEASGRAIARCRRAGSPLAIVHVDLDDFKTVNDLHGHPEGDRTLRLCAEAWRATIRDGDILARLGGDEFAIVLLDADRAVALDLLARLRARSPIAWSHGVAELRPGDDVEACLARADRELYAAKAAAPARTALAATVAVHGDLPPSAAAPRYPTSAGAISREVARSSAGRCSGSAGTRSRGRRRP